jgi:CHAT domain-containing protein
VKRIAKLFPAAGKMLTAGKATRRNVAENVAGKSYFHFSGHAYFDLANPLRSALVLAGGEFIYAEDLLEHRFDLSQVKLFTLSACQTGMRDFRIPDEAIGFPSAVIQAGVPAVISTLWPVPDVSTALLLSHFYELHIGGEIDVASALGRAQNWLCRSTAQDLGLKVILENAYLDSRKADSKELERISFFERNPHAKPFEHPYYWAGFILHGCGQW